MSEKTNNAFLEVKRWILALAIGTAMFATSLATFQVKDLPKNESWAFFFTCIFIGRIAILLIPDSILFALSLKKESIIDSPPPPPPPAPPPEGNQRSVFVVHGRNMKIRDSMFTFLWALDLKPMEWSEAVALTKKGSPHIGEILKVAFEAAQAIIVVFTPDEEARLKDCFREPHEVSRENKLEPQSRLNVIFEAGMAMGYCPERTILVEVGRCRTFSDIGGRHAIRLTNDPKRRHELAQRLKTAQCFVNTDRTEWLTAGDFEI